METGFSDLLRIMGIYVSEPPWQIRLFGAISNNRLPNSGQVLQLLLGATN
jgi:hypothetical protein